MSTRSSTRGWPRATRGCARCRSRSRDRYSGDDPALGSERLGPLIRDDVSLQGGADDNHYRGRVLERAEALWASSVGADHARFLVGGSSQGNIAALTAVGGPGVSVALDRTSHRSALAGLVVSGSTPVWVQPRLHPELGLPLGVEPRTLDGLPGDVTAVFVTTPSYVGTLADVAALAQPPTRPAGCSSWTRRGGRTCCSCRAAAAFELGADIATTSVHKALMGYTQTRLSRCAAPRITADRLDRAVDLTATTSPSATLMASIDATRAVMEDHGDAELERAIASVADMRARLRRIPGWWSSTRSSWDRRATR